MFSGKDKAYWLRAAVLALWVLTVPVWLAAQHGMESEQHGMRSEQQAVIARELAQSVHAKLACSACHGEMGMEMGGRPDPANTCGRCHERAWAAYRPSVHAVAARRGTPHAPTCVVCHGSHGVRAVADPLAPVSKPRVSGETCARCHESVRLTAMHRLPADVVPDFRESFHGLSAALGDQRVANCASCHGYHEIRPSRDPLSSVNAANLQQTCGSCHVGAAPGFAKGGVHHRPDTFGHKLVDIARAMYLMMITVTISLMLAHNGLDLWGRLRDRWRRRASKLLNFDKQSSTQAAMLREAENPAKSESEKSPTYHRFTLNERVQHWVLAASFGLLALTGFALKYTWAIPGLEAQQGALLRGVAHRAAAVVFMALAVYHLGYMALTRRGRYNLRALVPRIRSARDVVCRCAACLRLGPPSVSDWRDLIQTVKYNLGLAPTRPAMGRFTYAEKMEYLALVWGSVVMIFTGLALWFEVPFLNTFPYWAFDLATTVHFYEAVLATSAIVVWHFYYTIFNPDVFPLSKAMVTGRLDREEMEREHALEMRTLEREISKET
jgi:cytochrome b subunit of formate dehydrogenase